MEFVMRINSIRAGGTMCECYEEGFMDLEVEEKEPEKVPITVTVARRSRK